MKRKTAVAADQSGTPNDGKRPIDQLATVLMTIEQRVLEGEMDTRAALGYIVEAIASTDGLDGAAIALCEGDQLVCTASRGQAPAVGTTFALDSGPYCECLAEARMIRLERGDEDLVACASPAAGLLSSAVLLPLRVAGHHAGTLVVYSHSLDRLSNSHIIVLGTASTIAGFVAARLGSTSTARSVRDVPYPDCSALESAVVSKSAGDKKSGGWNCFWLIVCGVSLLTFVGALFASKALIGAHIGGSAKQHYAADRRGFRVDEVLGEASLKDATEVTQRERASLEGGEVVTRVHPDYPRDASGTNRGGDVVGTLVVSSAGVVNEVRIASGDPEFIPAVEAAVAHWRFAPFRRNGRGVSVLIPLRVSFKVER